MVYATIENLRIYHNLPEGTVKAVDDVSFEVGRAKIIGLVGESGCGKSTLGKYFVKLLAPVSGSMFYKGEDIAAMGAAQIRGFRRNVQAQVIKLLDDLKAGFDLSYLFIAHDLSVVEHVCDRIAVMYLGKIVEIAKDTELYTNPLHPYTQALLSAIPLPDPRRKKARTVLKGEVPSPINPPAVCRFHSPAR